MKSIKRKILKGLSLLVGIFALSTQSSYSFDMKPYCAIPPFMETSSKPNVILVIDYSGSMQ